eukprot:TRINITY_DN28749_c0_g2_i2.p1 TRINITY_DN28749_c0_g2~~TRINITY_DN28749_c0_g2_i2.p1  ORF type:complete len:101 (+),score=2.67 TRINITY_DN28749_c0_g2_i2:379-681(+)
MKAKPGRRSDKSLGARAAVLLTAHTRPTESPISYCPRSQEKRGSDAVAKERVSPTAIEHRSQVGSEDGVTAARHSRIHSQALVHSQARPRRLREFACNKE